MEWRTIRKWRPVIERKGYFVEEIKETHMVCTHLEDKEEIFYYIFPKEDDYVIYKVEFEERRDGLVIDSAVLIESFK